MTKPEMPDCRVCEKLYYCKKGILEFYSDTGIRCAGGHPPCINGNQFKQSQPIRLYEIEVKDEIIRA